MIQSKVAWALAGALVVAVFARAALQPTQIAAGELLYEIPRPNPITDSDFGDSIAVSGTTAIIGTTGTNAYPSGAYVVDLKTGQPLFRLADAVGADESPFWVAIDGDR